MATNLFIPKGIVKQYDSVRGFGFNLSKWFRESLKKLNVAFYDDCCPDASGDFQPVRFNADTDELERFNDGQWEQVNPTFLTGGGFTGTISGTDGDFEFENGILISFTPAP